MKIVYAYLDPRVHGIWPTTEMSFNHEPFYIGEGKVSRQFDHLKDLGASHKAARIREILSQNFNPIIVVVKDHLSKDESTDLETNLIKQLGTRAIIDGVKRGPLTNQRLYGKKGNISEETKQKMSLAKKGIKFTNSHKEKLSLARKGRSHPRSSSGPLSDEHKLKISVRQLGRVKSESERTNISRAQKGRVISPEHREKLSLSCKGRSSPNTRKWQIEFESTPSIVVENIRIWCENNGIIINSLRNTLNSGKFYRGMKLLKIDHVTTSYEIMTGTTKIMK